MYAEFSRIDFDIFHNLNDYTILLIFLDLIYILIIQEKKKYRQTKIKDF